MDEGRRQRERAARLDPMARGHILIDRIRAGELRQDAVALAAYMGREDACLATGIVAAPAGSSIMDVFGVGMDIRKPRGNPAFDLLVSFGTNVCAMWAFDTAIRAIPCQSDQDAARDRLLMDSLLRWILDDSMSNRNAVEVSMNIMLQEDPELDIPLWRVMLNALRTVLDIAPDKSAISAIMSGFEAGDLEPCGHLVNLPWPIPTPGEEWDRQRAALAKIVLLEDQPFDEDGKARPIPVD